MLLDRKRAEKKMEQYGLDALIATSPANVFYISDLCSNNCFALLPCEHSVEPAIIASIGGPTPVVLMTPPHIGDVRFYGEFYTTRSQTDETLTNAEQKLVDAQESWSKTKIADPIELLIALLEERGITKGRIGLDESALPLQHPFWQRIKHRLPLLEVVLAGKIFREIRMIKSDEEIRRIQEAVRITEKAWETALDEASAGMTEREFAEIYQHTILSEGGRITSFMGMYGPPIAFGRRTAFVDIWSPSDYKLRKGDILRFDGGCSYMGYPCDMARSAVLGQPSEKLIKYWKAIFEGESLAIDMAQPGVKASEIFKKVVETVRKSGIAHYKRHHTGHGWGIEKSDPPRIGPNDHTLLEEGMVLCFETPYYEVGWGGILHEDIVVITKGKPRYLTKFEGELRIV